MSDSELLAYFSRNNMFREDQNSPEWNRSFDRIRKRYGAPQPNPLTGLGADYIDLKMLNKKIRLQHQELYLNIRLLPGILVQTIHVFRSVHTAHS